MERLIGIDFGTSTSVIRTKMYDGDKPVGEQLLAQPVVFNNGASMVPTVVRCKNDVYSFGYEAEIPSKNSEVFTAFKLDLQSDDAEKQAMAKELTVRFFEYLYSEYKHQEVTGFLGDTAAANTTYLSYPVKWSGETQNFMIETAKAAGFENVVGMDEAEAAIRAITLQCRDVLQNEGLISDGVASNVLLIDMGAGTTDIVICKYTPGANSKNEILTTWPKGGKITFGGREVDAVLRDYVISKFPGEAREQIESRIGIERIKAWKENTVSPALKAGETVTECGDAENIAYYMDIDLEPLCLDRDELERILGDYIAQFALLVSDAMLDSGLNPEDIDLIVLTGGHSKWYFVEDILSSKNTRFGEMNFKQIKENPKRILSVALPQETVALGLIYSRISGTLSFDRAAHYWKTYLETNSIDDLMKAAQAGHIRAMSELGVKYYTGDRVERNVDKAIGLYKKAAEAGLNVAHYNLGCYYLNEKQYAEAFDCFTKAAEAGLAEAYNNLGYCHENGLGAQKDGMQALECYKKSYELGYTVAYDNYVELKRKMGIIDRPNSGDMLEYAKSINNIVNFNFTVGEAVPEQKVKNLLGLTVLGEDIARDIICFWDGAFFGLGKFGFLLTSKRLYWRDMWTNLSSVELGNIENIFQKGSNIMITAKGGFNARIYCACDELTKIIVFLQKILGFARSKTEG
ncbi:MAG: SEL1-like repeat protein [Clostridia bacterium]|nr:SEL1-like repeat protein [Clostridia bacterium]